MTTITTFLAWLRRVFGRRLVAPGPHWQKVGGTWCRPMTPQELRDFQTPRPAERPPSWWDRHRRR